MKQLTQTQLPIFGIRYCNHCQFLVFIIFGKVMSRMIDPCQLRVWWACPKSQNLPVNRPGMDRVSGDLGSLDQRPKGRFILFITSPSHYVTSSFRQNFLHVIKWTCPHQTVRHRHVSITSWHRHVTDSSEYFDVT